MMKDINRCLSIAPMMEYTHRHFRYFVRCMTRHTLLYTEMVVTGAILQGDANRFLAHDAKEYPLALQLGGSDPKQLQACAKIAAARGFSEINLNVGCPSNRVQAGGIGACLMRQAPLVAECVAQMKSVVDIPVTVKTRIGVDRDDSPAFLHDFIEQVAAGGCDTFIVHARKAWLTGLNPKQNRSVPPLDYDRVYDLVTRYPRVTFIMNGGIENLTQADIHLKHCQGVMLGRAAVNTPALFLVADRFILGQGEAVTLSNALSAYLPYVYQQASRGEPLRFLLQPLFGLMTGQPGAKNFRKRLNEIMLSNTLSGLESLAVFEDYLPS